MQQIGLDATLNNVPDFTAGINTMNKAVDGFASNSKDQGGSFASGFGEIVTGALRKIGELGVEALLKAGQAVAGFVTNSIGLAGDFEQGMLNFQSVAGKAVDAKGLEDFRDLFVQIGKELPVSTSEVQQAAAEMVKGGIDPAIVAAGGLRQNIQFAAAAMEGDLVMAAEISSKILGGWADANATAQQKADFLTHSTDLLTKAANASAVDVQGLSLGIFNAQGIAKTAGVSFDDLTTTLAALAPRFASSSEAGTSLKNMIARLQPQTADQTGAMRSLGLYTEEAGSAFYNAQGNFIGFEQSAQLLQESLKGLTKEQQASLLQTIFGNDAMGSAAALADMGAAGYRNMAGAMEEANGVAEAAALKQQGFNTALDNAKGSVEALQITVGSALLPVLTDLLNNVVAPAINAFTDWADAIFSAEDPIAALVDQINTFSPILGTVVAAIADFITSGGDLGVVADDLNEGMAGLGDAFLAVVDTAKTVAGAVQDVINWFNKGSAASDDLGGAIDDLSGIWAKAIDVVDNVMAGYQDIAQSVLPIVTAFVEEHGDEISAFFKTAYDQIIRIVNLALDLYDAIVPPILHAIAGFIQEHADDIQTILSGAWDIITGVIGAALQLIEGIIRIALDLINGDWSKAWTDLQTMSAGFVESLTKIITGFLDIIAGFFGTSLEGIVDLWQNNWDMLVDIVTQTDWVQVGRDVVEGVVNGVQAASGQLIDAMIDMAKDAWEAVKDFFGITSPSVLMSQTVGGPLVEGIMKGIGDMLPGLMNLVSDLGDDLVKAAEGIADDVQSAIADSFSAGANIDRQIAKNIDDFAKKVLPEYQQATAGMLQTAEAEARSFADPKEGAAYFAQRSKQILEYAELQKDLAEAETSIERERIRDQMLLINRAQSQEIKAFQTSAAASESPTQALLASIQSILANPAMPGILDSPIVRELNALMNQLNTAVSGQVSPGARQANVGSSYNYNTNLSMPIYTNQSPSVMTDSMAIAGAALL